MWTGTTSVASAGLLAAVGGLSWWSKRRTVDDLSGEVVAITGGSRGLGYQLAREFGRRGCRVAICARDGDRLRQAQRVLVGEGIEIVAEVCDVGDRGEADRFVEMVADRLGPIDILINNAGVIQVGPLESLTEDDFEKARRTMFDAILHTTLAALPSMLARGDGRIVNITSIGGRVGIPHLLPYVAAKYAATGFSEALRAELAGTGVSVTTISPGLMRTGSHLNAEFAGRAAEEARWFSLGASLPLVSMSAERAARQIADATARREATRTLTVPANLVARLHGLAPGLTIGILSLTNRYVLPGRIALRDRERGADALAQHRGLEKVTVLGRRAGVRYLQYPIYPLPRPEEGAPLREAQGSLSNSIRA